MVAFLAFSLSLAHLLLTLILCCLPEIVKYVISFFLFLFFSRFIFSISPLSLLDPDHDAILTDNHSNIITNWYRSPGLWKFDNTLLNDDQYIDRLRETCPRARNYYSHLIDKRLFWVMIKMELWYDRRRFHTPKINPNELRYRELDILWKLDLLDNTICNNISSPDIQNTLQEYENLKFELKSLDVEKRLNVVG